MGKPVPVYKTEEFKEGTMKKALLEGSEILIAKVGDKYYAADNRCPHLKGDLSQGKLEGTVVTCPLHGSQFDLKDGQVVRWTNWPKLLSAMGKLFKPAKPLKVYKTSVERGKILIDI